MLGTVCFAKSHPEFPVFQVSDVTLPFGVKFSLFLGIWNFLFLISLRTMKDTQWAYKKVYKCFFFFLSTILCEFDSVDLKPYAFNFA